MILMESNKQKLTDIIAKLKEKGLVFPTTTSTYTPVNMTELQARIKELVEKIKAKKNE